MESLKLGNIIEGEAKRDAIHIAIAPVTAAERLSPGQHVGFIGETVGKCKNPVGIVDPYLSAAVFKGERFWLFLYPNTVTSLRHQWEHPAFDNREEIANASQVWLCQFADHAGISYEELLHGAKDYLEHMEYLCDGGRWEGFSVPGEFWDHYEAVTKTKVPEGKRGSFFSCSC